MKIMLKSSQERGHWSNENMFRREIDVLASLDHPYIVKYHSFYEDKNYLYAVLEKCDGGELFDQILQQGYIGETRSTVLTFQMLTAINYVHSQGIVHRDVKAENFLFSTDGNDSDIKLIDFGMSERLSTGQVLTDVCGSPHYLAPELIRRKYSFKADVWALGVLVYLMLYGKYPFDGSGTSAIVKEILTKKIDWTTNQDKPQVSDLAQSFLKFVLHRNPDKRPTATEALKHPWLAIARNRLLSARSDSPLGVLSMGSGDEFDFENECDMDMDLLQATNKGDLIVIGTEETRYSQRGH